MTMGADADTSYENNYTLVLTGELGIVITADTADSRVSDFNIKALRLKMMQKVSVVTATVVRVRL